MVWQRTALQHVASTHSPLVCHLFRTVFTREYSVTQGSELSHTLSITVSVLRRPSSLNNAVPLHSINVKLVLFSLKYLGRSFIYRVQANFSSSANSHVTAASSNLHLHTHILQIFFLMCPFPSPSSTGKMTVSRIHFIF